MVTLLEEGKLTLPIAYGSAFSGIDTFASAVDQATGGLWTYEFASEPDPIARRVLLRAWSRHGLSELGRFKNACSLEACMAPTVDLFVCTPECMHAGVRRAFQAEPLEERCGPASNS